MSVAPEIRADVKERMTGEHRDAIERVVRKLHVFPCPNPNKDVCAMELDAIVHLFWEEFKAFQIETSPFDRRPWWNSPDVALGKSHTWHEMYSLHHTKVLGPVGCRTCSKQCGIGAAERGWGDVKSIKTGKRASIGTSIEKRAILYSTAKITQARIKQVVMEKIDAEGRDAMFGDDDIK